jgi:hypothetical protein
MSARIPSELLPYNPYTPKSNSPTHTMISTSVDILRTKGPPLRAVLSITEYAFRFSAGFPFRQMQHRICARIASLGSGFQLG